jgi:flagellar basal-body rod modification protein FlgD
MGVEGIGSALASQVSGSQSTTTGKSGSDLTISDFFQLMAAQLQNQSMYDTVDNAEFMSQMVQFSTLSQMEELSNAFQSNLAVSMIGKTVNVSAKDGHGVTQAMTGVVSQVSYSDGSPQLMVNGQNYKLADVTEVTAGNTAAASQAAG